jgi:hypothetical protein
LAGVAVSTTLAAMTLTATSNPPLRIGRMFGGALLGTTLVTVGLVADYLTIATPFVSTLVPAQANRSSVGIALGVWSFTLIAGGAMLIAGTSRLAGIVAMLRNRSIHGGPAARALASASNEVSVASGVILGDGTAIPELVIGAFGAAVVHTMPPSKLIRHGARWETRTSEGWLPTDDPLDTAARDADRVRRWLSLADLDFVVRVYAAVVVDDRAIQRSPHCATITAEQIPGWIAALPRQRTLTKGRRDRLLAMARASTRT